MNENKYNESVIISVTEWINNNLDQRLSVDDIAIKAGYSKWYLQKLFARYHDETLARYIRKKKLNASILDLKNSQVPIINLALKYHFESQQSFTRSFKQVMGCTPSACRKRPLNSETPSHLADSAHPCTLCSYAQREGDREKCSEVTHPIRIASRGFAQRQSARQPL